MNTNHIDYEKLIAHAARELSEAESAIVVDHLTTCSECDSTVVAFKAIRGLMRGDFGVEPSATVVGRAHAIFFEPRVQPTPPRRVGFNIFQIFQSAGNRLLVPALVALLFAIVFMLGQAVIASADTSLPGDYLYPIKINVEGLQLTFTSDKNAKVDLLLANAQKRVDEVAALKDQGRYNYIPITISTYENTITQATDLLDNLANTDPDSASSLGDEAQTEIKNNTAVLTGLLNQVPLQAQTAIQHAITESQKNSATVDDVLKTKPGKSNSSRTRRPTATPTSTPKPQQVAPNAKPSPTDGVKNPGKQNPPDQGEPTTKPNGSNKPTLTASPTPTPTPTATPGASPTTRSNKGQSPSDQNGPTDDKGLPGPNGSMH